MHVSFYHSYHCTDMGDPNRNLKSQYNQWVAHRVLLIDSWAV